ncbi:MAG: signal peptidase I [Candidatus Peribacteraceae bacterium]|jgi:signal peptidase I|nr:signal peptidase I [Candidatus Peribacteraceae bacterium]MDP7645976.1 signal peptidase I [Candidatus Peribacteraceae bacterium]|tara:strand:+ start:1054 stop:1665 length:612 start_codon:yes stop_codon:yes gene_type:complete
MPGFRKESSAWINVLDVVLNIIIIIAIVVVIRIFLVSPFQVEGSSMVNTLEHNQYIIINKLAFWVGKPQRGDVVVFRPPSQRKKHYVKRVIGLPGDTVAIREGHVFLTVSGETKNIKLDESYLNEKNNGNTYQHPPSTGNTNEVVFNIPDGNYFLLGDNRQGSLDSRSFNPHYIPEDDISGKVWFIALPIKKIHALQSPEYQL